MHGSFVVMLSRIAPLLACVFALIGPTSCASLDIENARSNTISIANAEDLALLEGGRWIIASSMTGGATRSGALYAIDTETEDLHLLYPSGVSKVTENATDCFTEIAKQDFAPHGITIHVTATGETQLFVVNHGGRESIELFSITLEEIPSLSWTGCIEYPEGSSGNGVAVSDDGTIYAARTSLFDSSKTEQDFLGDVVFRRPGENWKTVPNSEMMGPNGIVVSPGGEQIFVNAWPIGTLAVINTESGQRKDIDLPLLPDNIKWSDQGTLLVTGHRAPMEEVMSCYISPEPVSENGSAYAEIDPQNLEIIEVTDVDLGLATTAIDVGQSCWLGTARGSTIGRLPHSCSRAIE